MIKFIKKFIAVIMVLVFAAGFSGCEKTESQNQKEAGVKYTETLRVYNASEYIDLNTIKDFEKEFLIKVEYYEFDSNEDMYNKIIKNPGAYDVLVPSDYTVDRLIKEDRLEKLDKSKIPNIKNVADEYLRPEYDPENDYAVPYMVGTLGILYNTKKIAGIIDSWEAVFDPQYRDKALMIDSQRDAIGAALKLFNFSMNSGDDAELVQAKAKLAALRDTAFDESEIIRDKLVAGEAIIGIVYSGDAKTAVDRNPDLAYVIPFEGANKWVDGFVILKDTQHSDAAHKFINFMCRANIAIRNMTKIGYTSPIKGAWSEFGGNKIMFPSVEELTRCEAFLYDAQATQKYDKLWNELR